jgi:hypothetical protein
MFIGQTVLIKHNNSVQEGKVEEIGYEDLQIRLKDDTLVSRKYWEVKKIKYEE